MEIKGNVVFKKMYVGSKSEHEAVCLHTAEDAYIKLRRPGENPFRDEVLVGLVGKNVTLGEKKLVTNQNMGSTTKLK